MKIRYFSALVFSVILLAACGTSSHISKSPLTCTTQGPPCSSITPEGAKEELTKSHYVKKTVPTLIGSSIKIDNFGVQFIAQFENVTTDSYYCPYWDPYGNVWTRGFGETDWNGDFGGRCISNAEARYNLHYLVESEYQYAIRNLNVNLNHHQIDALDSFAWNLGAGIFVGSLRYNLQHRYFQAAGDEMLQYDRAGGQVLPGLVTRRRDEVSLLLTPEPEETKAKRERERKGHEQLLAQLKVQQRNLRVKLLNFGCRRRVAQHQHLGPRCKAWFRTGNEVDAHIRLEEKFISDLR